MSDLLRQTGIFESGFEVGVLLGGSPKFFEEVSPFYENMLAGWSITREELEACCETESFDEFYARLKDASPLVEGNHKLFDKTPRYATKIGQIAEKTNAPILFIYKDPRASVYSDFKRAGTDSFEEWFESYAPRKIAYMRRCYEGYEQARELVEQAVTFSLEDLCFSARDTATRIYGAVGEAFQVDYLLLNNLRYKNTRAKFVTADIVLEYRSAFSPEQIKFIEQTLKEFDSWFCT